MLTLIMEKFKLMLDDMKRLYLNDPENAVRSKKMIGKLENFLKESIKDNLTDLGRKELLIKNELVLFQAEKEKNVDIALIHPINGPIITIGVRSQMSSVAKIPLPIIKILRVSVLDCNQDTQCQYIVMFICIQKK